MSIHKHIRSITAIAKEIGIVIEIEHGGKHLKVVISGPKGRRKVTAGNTLSDHRALLNLRMDMRRTAREVGLLAV